MDLIPANSISFGDFEDELRQRMAQLEQNSEELKRDIQYIKAFFEAKQAKKEKRREKREQERLAAEKQEKARQVRTRYEDIVWTMKHHPWEFMPSPKSELSPKELELVSLLAANLPEEDVAARMNMKKSSINARLCVINKALQITSRAELLSYYADYQKIVRKHRRRRFRILISWLLNPPPGFIYRHDLKLKRALRSGKKYPVVVSVPRKTFNDMQHYKHNVLKLKVQRYSNREIAERLKLREGTLKGYLSEIRGSSMRWEGIPIPSEEILVSLYKTYLKQERHRK